MRCVTAVVAVIAAASFVGHMMGLDVHDMENLGEDIVGDGPGYERSTQFGLGYLRLARPLEPGSVLTVEPGLYFIPAPIDQWKAEGRHAAFINWTEVDKFRDAHGLRCAYLSGRMTVIL